MNNKKKLLTTAGILAAAVSSIPIANAHLGPKASDGMEKCYGVAKAHKNDCASKANKHSCAGQSKIDNDQNEWIKLPQGLCEKLVGGTTEPQEIKAEKSNDKPDDHRNHDH